MRTILDDVRAELATDRYREWAASHKTDDGKVHMELAAKRRPTSRNPYARCLIEAIRAGFAEIPAVPLPLVDLGRNVMFTAWNPETALRAPANWKVAVTADPGPDGKWDRAVRAAAPKLKERGLLAVWGVQTQVGAARIRQLAAEIKADYTIFQAETVEEYDTAMEAGANLIVGNPNSWTADQRQDATKRCDDGQLAVMFEVYTNAGHPWPDTASSLGVPICCEVLGVGWGPSPYQVSDYLPRTPAGVWATASIYLAENMSDDSWGRL